MKLSMWILADWLKKYNPVIQIDTGDMILEKLNIQTQNVLSTDESVLLVKGSLGTSTETGLEEEVILTNQSDVILLKSYPLEDIVNEISNAFAYYNSWENKLLYDARQSNPEQKIIDDCAELFGPIFLIDMEMKRVAMSKQYGMGSVNQVWDELLINGGAYLEVIEKLKDSCFFSNYGSFQKCNVTEVKGIVELNPYNKCIVISHTDEDGEVIGQMLICSNMDFNKSEIHLASIISNALSDIKNKEYKTRNSKVISNFFSSMLNSQEQNESYKNFIYTMNNWSAHDEYCIISFGKKAPKELTNTKTMVSMLNTLLNNSIIVHDQGYLVACVNISKNNQYHEQLKQISVKYELQYGYSFVFEGLDKINHMKRQSLVAIRKNKIDFLDTAFDTMIDNLDDLDFIVTCIHPSLRVLREFDRENHTQLGQTLRSFLQCERSWIETSRKIFVHRNTIVSRINKIHETCSLNLDNPQEREYILFSFRIIEKMETPIQSTF